MKKIVSILILVVILLSSSIGINITSYAEGWATNPKKINVNQDVSESLSLSDYCDVLYYDCYLFSLPTEATLTISLTSQSYYDITAKIFSVNRIEEYEDEIWEDWVKYDSANGNYVIKNEKVTLPAGDYYFLVRSGNEFGPNFVTYAPYLFRLSCSFSIKTPSGLKCIARTTSAEKVAWNKVAGVTGYQVQCSDGGTKWAQNKVTSGNSAVFSGLTAGGKYKFRVRAYKKIDGVNYFSAWSPTLNSCAKPATVTLKGVSSPKHTQIKTTWAKAGGVVTGYQIVYSRNKAFTNIAAKKNVTGKNTVTYTGKNFTKGRTYYIAVRAYTVFVGQVYYGKYSAIKAVKCK